MTNKKRKKVSNFPDKKYKNENNEISKDLTEYKLPIFVKTFFSVLLTFCVLLFLTNSSFFVKSIFLYSYLCPLIGIFLYYLYLAFISQKIETARSIFLNFGCIISLYNIFLLLNPLSMVRISSEYLVSNIFYFYISFLIVSFDFKIYEKIVFIVKVAFGMFGFFRNKAKFIPYSAFLFVLLSIASGFIDILLHINDSRNDFIKMLSDRSYFWFYLYVIFLITNFLSYKLNFSKILDTLFFVKMNSLVNKLEKKIDVAIHFFLCIFKVEKLEPIALSDKKEKVKMSNIIFFTTIKIFIPFVLYGAYNDNSIYLMYLEKNKGYCINKNISNNDNIIKLNFINNNNILFINIADLTLKEEECKKEPINIKLNYKEKINL